MYTSGTTGRPKGVMMSHSNIVNNVRQMWNVTQITEDDVILSYLPLSHTFERTAGAYTGVAFGACLAFSRGVSQLRDDLADVRPTVMSSVPRIYERFYNHLMAMRAKMPAKGTSLTGPGKLAGGDSAAKTICRRKKRAALHRQLHVAVSGT